MKLTEKLHYQNTLMILLDNHVALMQKVAVIANKMNNRLPVDGAAEIEEISNNQFKILKKELIKVAE